jgi:hypothetical protein
MSAMNRHYLSLWECGKPQLYGRAVDTVQAHAPQIALRMPFGKSSTSTKTE